MKMIPKIKIKNIKKLNFCKNLVLNDSPKRIDQATYSSATNEVISEESQISLNKDTSNLPELLELLPTNLNINIDVETIEEPSFFAYNQSQLEGNVDVIIPFDFKIKGLEFEDNIDLEIDIAENVRILTSRDVLQIINKLILLCKI